MKHYRINDIKLAIDEPKENILSVLSRKLKLRDGDIFKWEIRRRSIDARDKSDVHFVYAVDVWTERELIKDRSCSAGKAPVKLHGLSVQLVGVGEAGETELALVEDRNVVKADGAEQGKKAIVGRPVVVGMGPCGLFAALELAKQGYRPLVLERGPEMKDRIQDVERFRKSGLLNPEGNMLYGEGGAGTFSDGKIGTGIKDGNIRNVLRAFADAGAGEEIMYLNKPHIGTDVLRSVIVNLRNKVIKLGGEVRFNTRLDRLIIEDGELVAIDILGNSGAGISCERDVHERIETNAMILAVGHSARDTFAMINEEGLELQQKAFSIGVRMEHSQKMIDESQYGTEAIEKYGDLMPPADYKLSTKTSNGRGVYSFCMCPGGEVVVCTTAEGELCVNGMSNRKRDSGIANSGILCDVRVEDYNDGDASDVLAGVRFQEKYERLAYENGMKCRRKPISMLEKSAGMRFNPPNCSMEDFLDYGKEAKSPDEEGNSNADAVMASLPEFASEAIREAVPLFARKIRGYDNPDAIITAVETRSSSPVRIVRDENGQSNIKGIFPAGEGAGYAGGITSAACDGIRAARSIMRQYRSK